MAHMDLRRFVSADAKAEHCSYRAQIQIVARSPPGASFRVTEGRPTTVAVSIMARLDTALTPEVAQIS